MTFKLFVHSYFKARDLFGRVASEWGQQSPSSVLVARAPRRMWPFQKAPCCVDGRWHSLSLAQKETTRKFEGTPQKRQTEQCSKKKKLGLMEVKPRRFTTCENLESFTSFGQYCINWFWGVCPLKVVWKEGFLCKKQVFTLPELSNFVDSFESGMYNLAAFWWG